MKHGVSSNRDNIGKKAGPMMHQRYAFSLTICFSLLAAAGWADIVGPYRGFDEMIRRSSAIAVVRIPPMNLKPYDPALGSPYHPHMARVLRTIKGDIPENADVLVYIQFYSLFMTQKIGANRSTTDTVTLDALQALDQFIVDDARLNENRRFIRWTDKGSDYLLFLERNDPKPHEPGSWQNLNHPGSAIPLDPGAFESAHREEMRARAKEEKSNPAQARSEAARAKAARREIIRLILTRLGVVQPGLRRRIEPLLTQ